MNLPKNPFSIIVTQTPLPNTHADFWRMIFETKAILIIGFENDVYDTYWPEYTSIFGEVVVTRMTESSPCPFFIMREFHLTFKVKKKNDEKIFSFH